MDSLHVRDASLKTASDHKLLNFARLDDRIIVTKDSDFAAYIRSNPDVKVGIIWLKVGNLRNREFEPWLVNRWPQVCTLFEQGHLIVEVR